MKRNSFIQRCTKSKERMKNAAFITLSLFISSLLHAQSPQHGQLRRGDQHYEQKQYRQAEQAYGKAQQDPVAMYNAGNAAYQQGKYDAAAEWYRKAAATLGTPATRSDAFFNLGNAYLQQGKYRESIAAYERSLRLQPNRADGKKNLQIARNKLREQQEPPPPPPPPQKPPPPPPPRNNYVDRAQLPQKKELPSGDMSAEKARNILDGMIDQEEQKNARRYRALPPEANPGKTKKDW